MDKYSDEYRFGALSTEYAVPGGRIVPIPRHQPWGQRHWAAERSNVMRNDSNRNAPLSSNSLELGAFGAARQTRASSQSLLDQPVARRWGSTAKLQMHQRAAGGDKWRVDRNFDVTVVTSSDSACHFSTLTTHNHAHVHYPRFASLARVAVSRREGNGFECFRCRGEPMSHFYVNCVSV